MTIITFVGDVFLTGDCRVSLPYDNVIANFESPITDVEIGAPAKINLKTTVGQVENLTGFRLLAVCLANNHICDFREAGLTDTIEYFDNKGITHFGAGMNSSAASKVKIVPINGHTVGFIGAVCNSTAPIYATENAGGTAIINLKQTAIEIQKARELGAKTIVASFHWGAEEVAVAKLEDIKLARAVIDMGVDLVIGHHAHCIQPFEQYKGKYIFYGLGNCIFPDFIASSMYCEQKKTFTSEFRKRQEYWNNQSLAVNLDLKTGNIVVDVLQQNNGFISIKTRNSKKYQKAIKANTLYKRAYKYWFIYYKVRYFFFRFLRDPKMPAPKHVKGILSLLRKGNYK